MSLDRFSSGRILAGGLFFGFFYFYNVERKYVCMIIFIFMPPQSIFPWVFTHRRPTHMGLWILYDAMMECSKGTLLSLFFSNMQQ
jgi:hypothetical protein